jgi:hypothetical protein
LGVHDPDFLNQLKSRFFHKNSDRVNSDYSQRYDIQVNNLQVNNISINNLQVNNISINNLQVNNISINNLQVILSWYNTIRVLQGHRYRIADSWIPRIWINAAKTASENPDAIAINWDTLFISFTSVGEYAAPST